MTLPRTPSPPSLDRAPWTALGTVLPAAGSHVDMGRMGRALTLLVGEGGNRCMLTTVTEARNSAVLAQGHGCVCRCTVSVQGTCIEHVRVNR